MKAAPKTPIYKVETSIEVRSSADDYKRFSDITPYLFKGKAGQKPVPMVCFPNPTGRKDIHMTFNTAKAVLKNMDGIKTALELHITNAGKTEDTLKNKVKENRSKAKQTVDMEAEIQKRVQAELARRKAEEDMAEADAESESGLSLD